MKEYRVTVLLPATATVIASSIEEANIKARQMLSGMKVEDPNVRPVLHSVEHVAATEQEAA
jgi:hypothetical protein